MLRHVLLLVLIGLTGCRQPVPPRSTSGDEAPRPEEVVDASAGSPQSGGPTSAPVAHPVDPAEPSGPATPAEPPAPPTFEYPADLGGRVVLRAVAPVPPPPLPTERFGTTAVARPIPARLLNPATPTSAKHELPASLIATTRTVRPIPPREPVPGDLGSGAGYGPPKPTFPVAAGIDIRAPDVNRPPPLPLLGRPSTSRVSLADPTAELGHAAITTRPIRVDLEPAGFLKVTIPDPFVLGEQVRPRLPRDAEPGRMPVEVTPQRPR